MYPHHSCLKYFVVSLGSKVTFSSRGGKYISDKINFCRELRTQLALMESILGDRGKDLQVIITKSSFFIYLTVLSKDC